jgi:carboxyl-terminal processing protease
MLNRTGDMASRENIEARLDEIGEEDLGHRYVARHLREYGVGKFDAGKLRRIENYFRNEYPGKLPSVAEMAYKTASLYVEYYYDRIDNTDKDAVTTALLRCYVESTGDRYAVYRTAEELEEFDVDMSGEFVGIGVSVIQMLDPETGRLGKVIVTDVMSGGGAKEAGIQAGDLIIKVDGAPISDFDSSSLIKTIRGEAGTEVVITVLRAEREMDFACERRKIVEKTVEYRVDGGIGYIAITSFKSNTAGMFADALGAVRAAKVRGVVFDLRDNPGGYLDVVLSMLDMLAPEDTTLASYDYANGRHEESKSSGDGRALDVPVVVLCNENTASAAELFTSALRDFGAMGVMKVKTVGTKTYGKGVMQSTRMMLDGSSITLTTAFYNPPSGVNYDGVGITPDVVVEDVGGVADEQLSAALSELRKMMGSVDNNSSL